MPRNKHHEDNDPRQACRSRPRLGRATPVDHDRGPAVFSPARLRAWRHATATTYTTLAHAADTTPQQVQACERGTIHPDPAMITAWADALGCQADQLMSTSPDGPAEYWNAANQAMPKMTTDDLAIVADVILRGRAKRHPPTLPR